MATSSNGLSFMATSFDWRRNCWSKKVMLWFSVMDCIFFSAWSKDQPPIDCDVDDNDHASQYELDFAGQARRINDVQEIVLDEAIGIPRLASPDTQMVLEMGERAEATGQFDEQRPRRRGKVKQRRPAPPHGDCSTDQRKQDKRQVKYEDAVSGYSKKHLNAESMVGTQQGRGPYWASVMYTANGAPAHGLENERDPARIKGKCWQLPTPTFVICQHGRNLDGRLCHACVYSDSSVDISFREQSARSCHHAKAFRTGNRDR